jgi:hypothetical protein
VPGAVLDLLLGERAVERRRDCTEVHRCLVGDHVFGPVGHHHRDEVAPLDAEVGEPGRDGPHPGSEFLPAQRAQVLAVQP